MNAWRDFKGGKWQDRIDVRDFIQKNYTPYTGDESFLQPPTARTEKMLEKYEALCRAEQQNGGVLNIDTETVITATSFGPGYLDKENEIIVGLQTDEPLKRACNPFGGMRMVRSACEAYGYKVSDKIEEEFKYHKTHNDGVFSAYTDDVRAARHAGIITGLPMVFYSMGVRHLPLMTTGICQYVSPSLSIVCGAIMGEALTHEKLVSFLFIWAGVILYVLNTFYEEKQRKKTAAG